jgi:hypothetical protein
MSIVNENLNHKDLKDVLLPNISFDEFEPKTGEKENVAVVGFYVTEQSAGDDLAKFLSKSHFDIRDVEVTPNPNQENYYMVFVEMDRKEGVLGTIKEMVSDMYNLIGEADWTVKPLLSEEEIDISSDLLSTYIIESPDEYMTKEDFDNDKQSKFEESVLEFFTGSNALEVTFQENKLNLKDYRYNTTLEFVTIGEGKLPLEESGLNDLAIDTDFDPHLLSQLSSIKGNLSIVPINKHIVFHNTETDRVLVAKPC